jgi:hypothetical protein
LPNPASPRPYTASGGAGDKCPRPHTVKEKCLHTPVTQSLAWPAWEPRVPGHSTNAIATNWPGWGGQSRPPLPPLLVPRDARKGASSSSSSPRPQAGPLSWPALCPYLYSSSSHPAPLHTSPTMPLFALGTYSQLLPTLSFFPWLAVVAEMLTLRSPSPVPGTHTLDPPISAWHPLLMG